MADVTFDIVLLLSKLLMRIAGLGLGLWLLAGPTAWAQVPAWEMNDLVGNTTSSVNALVAADNGMVYMAGKFEGATVLGSIRLEAQGGSDGFVGQVEQPRPPVSVGGALGRPLPRCH